MEHRRGHEVTFPEGAVVDAIRRDFLPDTARTALGPQPAGPLPWVPHGPSAVPRGDTAEREWSADQTVQHGGSRSTPALHIKKRLQRGQGSALTDFHTRCPHRLLPAKPVPSSTLWSRPSPASGWRSASRWSEGVELNSCVDSKMRSSIPAQACAWGSPFHPVLLAAPRDGIERQEEDRLAVPFTLPRRARRQGLRTLRVLAARGRLRTLTAFAAA